MPDAERRQIGAVARPPALNALSHKRNFGALGKFVLSTSKARIDAFTLISSILRPLCSHIIHAFRKLEIGRAGRKGNLKPYLSISTDKHCTENGAQLLLLETSAVLEQRVLGGLPPGDFSTRSVASSAEPVFDTVQDHLRLSGRDLAGVMYLPRSLISHLYLQLVKTHHSLSPPVLLLVSLEPDALCACRILTALLKRDYIPHKIQPVSGYSDLSRIGRDVVRPMRKDQGGSGGVVVCLGVGGLIDLSTQLGLEAEETAQDAMGGVEVWLIDARRPWNLGNVFGGRPTPMVILEDGRAVHVEEGMERARIQQSYKPGLGGVIVFDDGDIDEELQAEREAYIGLELMPEFEDDVEESEDSEDEALTSGVVQESRSSKKRRSMSSDEDSDEYSDGGRPTRRRRSNSSQPIGVDREKRSSKKRKSVSDDEDSGEYDDEERPSRRRRSNSSNSISVSPRPRGRMSFSTPPPQPSSSSNPTSPFYPKEPSPRTLRRKFLRLRQQHKEVLQKYYSLGSSYSEPVSSLMYSLASDLGREDNDMLWQAIVGVTSLEIYGRTLSGVGIDTTSLHTSSNGWQGNRGERIRQVLRDEVRRLNPPELGDNGRETHRNDTSGVIPTTARSPTDKAIRLSPEPRFLLIRHWSLYDSMLHSPYLSAKLHIWSDAGLKRLHKLLAKMGVSLAQCKQSYTHMDMDLKRGLRESLLKYAPLYGLEGLVPPPPSRAVGKEGWGFVRSWGWKACLSANDVGVIIGAILEVGKAAFSKHADANSWAQSQATELRDEEGIEESELWVSRFFEAYDALENIEALKASLPLAQSLHRAILRTGSILITKKQIKDLRAFRLAVLKDGPDVGLFTHPAALTKLALWLGEALAEQEKTKRGKLGKGGRATPLVVAGLNESRGVYVVVGTGGGGGVMDIAAREERRKEREEKRKKREQKKQEKEQRRKEREENGEDEETESEGDSSDEGSEDDEEDEARQRRGYGRNNFGHAFEAVADETNARIKFDGFEQCVIEVKKEDLGGFLENLSMKAVIG